MRVHFRDWVMKGVEPPPSVYPTLGAGTLVEPAKQAMGFPSMPGLPAASPTGFMNPALDYDFGPEFNYVDGTGEITQLPPAIKHVIAMKAPRVNSDGNEMGGVPVVLEEAPLGTYLGWNITAAGFHQGAIVQLRRRDGAVREDESRTAGQRRPAAFPGRALWQPCRIRAGSGSGGTKGHERRLSVETGCRHAD